ncbi:MAG: CHAD domain-containing protein [Gemmatimonadetes bacterium]|nr:CHAD domain-containing protein [Gemmatimonadota bacterium]
MSLLDLGAPRAVRWLALRFLDQARAARVRLDDAGDAEALHDFRVALRRLRSTVRAYADTLDDAVGNKDRARLKALAHATGDSRDGEVMIEWMQTRRDRLPGAEHAGLDWLLDRLRARQDRLDRSLRKEVARDFGRERKRLARRLSAYRARVDAADPREQPRMGGVAAGLVAAHVDDLRRRLGAARSVDEQDALHEARISAKRLRYLLEPFGDELPDAAWAVRRLKRMQDTLGEMHDAHVAGLLLAAERAEAEVMDPRPEPDPLPGLHALAAAAREETERLYAHACINWLGGRAAEFLARVDTLAAQMRDGGAAADREIERKFLLRRMPRLPDGAVRTEIVQGYLPGERLQERVRRVRRHGEPPKYFRTVKVGAGISRTELEEETDEATFRRLWSLTRGRRVRKLRFKVPYGGLTWEIDRFAGRRLVLAEVELPSEDFHVRIPDWLRDYVERDVTGEDEYVNANLAR